MAGPKSGPDPLESIRPYARNARKHSREQVAQLAALIEKFGWTSPILVDEDGEIIAGHGRLQAAKLLGLEQVPVATARGWTEEEKRAFVIADNKVPESATWDDTLLAFELNALDVAGFDVSLTGFDDIGSKAAASKGGPKRKSGVVELAAPEYAPTFWITLRGPLQDQARVLDAVKKALGAPGAVEIETGVVE